MQATSTDNLEAPAGRIPSGPIRPPLRLASTRSQASLGAAAWPRVEQVLQAHYSEPDLQAARAVYSAVAAHRLSGASVWPMLVAPPGSMKTELLAALDGLPNLHLVDHVTPHTFISGQIEEHRKPNQGASGLLHRIGASGILVCSDFSTVLGMQRDHRASVLADLRRIYDGCLRKEFGTADRLDQREWRGRITLVVAATPDVDRHYSIFQTLGERFVMIRWPRAGGTEAALRAMNQDCKAARLELREAVHALFGSLPCIEPELPKELQHEIAALAEFAVRGRTHVPRQGYSKDIIYVPEPESATRLAQQLAQLAKGSALLEGRQAVNGEDCRLVRRVAFDCIPAMRRRVLDALIAGQHPTAAKLPDSTLHYTCEDLESVDLLSNGALSPLAIGLLQEAGVI